MSIYVELQERKRELQRLNDELNAEESTVVHSLYQKIEKQQSAIDDDDVEDVIRKAQAPLLHTSNVSKRKLPYQKNVVFLAIMIPYLFHVTSFVD